MPPPQKEVSDFPKDFCQQYEIDLIFMSISKTAVLYALDATVKQSMFQFSFENPAKN